MNFLGAIMIHATMGVKKRSVPLITTDGIQSVRGSTWIGERVNIGHDCWASVFKF